MVTPSYNGQDLRARAAKLQREYALRFCGARDPDVKDEQAVIATVRVDYFIHLDGRPDAKISRPDLAVVWTVNVCSAANCCRSENGRTA